MSRKGNKYARRLYWNDVISDIFKEASELEDRAVDVGPDGGNEAQKNLWKFDAF
jgi:hypothetical protein